MIAEIKKIYQRYFTIEKIFHILELYDSESSIALKLGKHVKTYIVKDYHIVGIFFTLPKEHLLIKIVVMPILAIAYFLLRFTIAFLIIGLSASLITVMLNEVILKTYNLPTLEVGAVFTVLCLGMIVITLWEFLKKLYKN